MPTPNVTVAATSASAAEIARFDRLAAQWWDPRGPMRPLHRMNPARIGWIEGRLAARFGAARLRLLDVGCGAGLAAEALARLGHDVLGVDAGEAVIAAAEAHAAGQGLSVRYRAGTAEALAAEGERFQVVTALEVIEHVTDPLAFLTTLGRLVEPGGMVFVSTLNRTPLAYAAAKIGAEYLLRWLPVGTHDWRKFLTPAELGSGLRAAGFRIDALSGLTPTLSGWRADGPLTVNYIVSATNE